MQQKTTPHAKSDESRCNNRKELSVSFNAIEEEQSIFQEAKTSLKWRDESDKDNSTEELYHRCETFRGKPAEETTTIQKAKTD